MVRVLTIRSILAVFLLVPSVAWSQMPLDSAVEKYAQERYLRYEEFVKKRQGAEQDFIDKRNAEYAEFLEQKWQAYQSYIIRQDSSEPQLKKPVIKPRKENLQNRQIPCREVVRSKNDSISHSVALPDDWSQLPRGKFTGVFYQTPYVVRLNNRQRYRVDTLTDRGVARAWRRMSDGSLNAMLEDCLDLRKRFRLADWGYIQMLERITADFFGASSPESVLMQVYLLLQSGYQVVPAIRDGRLFLLVEFEESVLNGHYVVVGERKYLVWGAADDSASDTRYYISTGQSSKEIGRASVRMSAMPSFVYSIMGYGNFTSRRYPTVSIKITPNQNVIDYCGAYPIMNNQWAYYVHASLSKEIKDTLYPVLLSNMRYKTQKEAVDILLDFLQTAFLYKDDISQFGYERPFFGDENFYYPYNDCEDRAILFAILVRELLGLEVLLVHFPAGNGVDGHVAAAVKFTDENISGGYFLVDEDKFVICDPTYINQGAGACMPKYLDIPARLIVL